MTIPRTFIIIKGQPKALQIEKFALGENNVYNVKFKNSPTTFHYSFRDVIWLKEAGWHDGRQSYCRECLWRRQYVFFCYCAEGSESGRYWRL